MNRAAARPHSANDRAANRLEFGQISDRGTAQTGPGLAGHWRSDVDERTCATLAERLRVRYSPDSETGCWNWTGRLTKGYARLSLTHDVAVYAHRLMYEVMVGPIPDGLELDHTCRNKKCVNPEHLEAVTHQENVDRYYRSVNPRTDTHCRHGHERTEENTYVAPNGSRICRVCRMTPRPLATARLRGHHRTRGGSDER